MNNLKLKGYGFNPSEQILIGYLRERTTSGRDYLVQDIIDLSHDICSYDPWDLPGCDSITPNDSERFFIYPKTYKYANSTSKVIGIPTKQVPNSDQRQPMINRATKNGKWKVSGVRVNVKSSDETKQVIGIKTKLYFKHNNCPNKTSCVLHQFELVDIDPCQDKYFLGKVIMKEFKPTNISSNNLNDRISIPEVRVELGPEPLVETEVTNEYEWTQSEQTNEFITPYLVFDNENSIDDGNEVISNYQSQEWSDLYKLCRFIDQQRAAGAEIEFPNLPPLDVAESSYSTDSVRKRSAMEVERLATGVETELAQQQAKRSRL
ncbi:NAC domain-containing protein 71 isoform X3 [Gossypium raimondii]|uniref:NAC domain-containing protein n=1 Tax=Gossypium raimondii TaxID=29730 RepID=A0A0D2RDV7_GOSRA|nr:NAC domain-containing protein 71 isoform X3 [Gossypium raimondii]KJB27851.1 hypothetical protein B456_005G013300 [Gossypium raimondii]